MNTLKRLLSSSLALLVMVAALFSVNTLTHQPVFAQADGSNVSAACDGVILAGGDCGPSGESGVKKVITTIIDILSIAVGAISIIMIIIGGLRYVVSAGDASGTTAARNTIIYALVGLVIVIFAQAIVAFVVGRVDTSTANGSEETSLIGSPLV